MHRVALSIAAGALVLLAGPALSFTSQQAAAGRATFEQSCAACHGANLRQLPGSVLAVYRLDLNEYLGEETLQLTIEHWESAKPS